MNESGSEPGFKSGETGRVVLSGIAPSNEPSDSSASSDLKSALFADREASFFRLRGGFPIPLAGACWWAMLGTLGLVLRSRHLWIFVAFVTSGLMFPLALLFAKIFNNRFMRDKTAVTDVLFPAFASMLLFWPIACSAWWSYPELVPLILAIGMSIHWPVIGWMYGRTALYTTHSVVRAIACFALWNWSPASRFTVLPFTVSAVYLLTVVAIFAASAPGRRGSAKASGRASGRRATHRGHAYAGATQRTVAKR